MWKIVAVSVLCTMAMCYIWVHARGDRPPIEITLPKGLLDKLTKETPTAGGNTSKGRTQSGGFYHDIDEKHWNIKLEAMNRLLPRQEMDANRRFPYGHAYYSSIYHPTWSCDVTERVGLMSDGGKFICDPHRIPKDCLIYSIGSNNDWSFEENAYNLLGCEIHTFDHTIDPVNMPKFVNFHKWGLGAWNSTDDILISLPNIIDKLGHTNRAIDILKVDCEGCETEAIRPLFQMKSWRTNPPIRQINIEFHWHRYTDLELLRAATDNGYVIFMKEANPFGRCCYEFSLLQLYVNDAKTGNIVANVEEKRTPRKSLPPPMVPPPVKAPRRLR